MTDSYTRDVISQFLDWETDKHPYLWRRRVETVLPHLPAEGQVLDAGCGDLSMIRFFEKERPDLEFTAMDLLPLPSNRSLRGDVRSLPFRDGVFDGVLLLAVIEHVPDQAAAIGEAYRVLVPGGVLILTTPNPLFGFPMAVAARLGLKYREGYENNVDLDRLTDLAVRVGFVVEEALGFLAAPFPSPLEAFEETLGSHRLGRKILMNQFLKARKPRGRRR